MDKIDEKILGILQLDGRISMQRLAKEIPMSVPATIERVRKLEDSGIVSGYTVNIDCTKMGKTINAYILFACNIGTLDHLIDVIKKDVRVVKLSVLAGKYALMIEVRCTDMTEYADFIYMLYPYGTTESYIVIKEEKSVQYDFGHLDNSSS